MNGLGLRAEKNLVPAGTDRRVFFEEARAILEPVTPCAGTDPVALSSASAGVDSDESDADTAFMGIAGVACSSAFGSSPPLSSPEDAGASDSHGSTPDEPGPRS